MRCADLAALNRLPEATEAARLLASAAEFREADVQSILPALATGGRAAPVVVTLLWSTLFDKFAPLDSRGLLQAYLDLVFGPPTPKDKHPKRTRRPGSRRIES